MVSPYNLPTEMIKNEPTGLKTSIFQKSYKRNALNIKLKVELNMIYLYYIPCSAFFPVKHPSEHALHGHSCINVFLIESTILPTFGA